MNAYELEQAAFYSACDHAEETVEYIQGYADGAFDLYVTAEVAQKILDCRKACSEATEKNGEYENNGWHLGRKPLEQIEL